MQNSDIIKVIDLNQLTMEWQSEKKYIYRREQYQPKENCDSLIVDASKRPLIGQTDLKINQFYPTDQMPNFSKNPQFQHQSQEQFRQKAYELNQRTASYPNGSQYQFLIYENKIHLLTDRLQCYMDEVDNLKKTNTIILSKLSAIESLDEDLENEKLKNLQLKEQLETYRDRLQDEKDEYDAKINEFKLKLQEKDDFIQLMRDENAKIMKKKDEQIAFLKQALREKTSQLDSYEKQLYNIQIQRLNTSDDFSSRDSLFTKQPAISQYNIRNSQSNNTINMHQSTISVEEKARQFVKKNQTQLKIAMKSISHAQKCLEIGGQQISTIIVEKENEKSLINLSRLSRSKVNKTYCK